MQTVLGSGVIGKFFVRDSLAYSDHLRIFSRSPKNVNANDGFVIGKNLC